MRCTFFGSNTPPSGRISAFFNDEITASRLSSRVLEHFPNVQTIGDA
ncbi:MAG: hypothetical protein QXR19_16440 [Candidatus Jordarchaeaceae archaeon]